MSSTSNSISSKKNFKIVLLGDSGVGKTALIQRYAHNRFQQRQNATIGIDFVGKNVNIKGHTFRLQLWDTAGQQRYRSLIPSYLKDAISAIFVFDITKPQSLQNLESWIQIFKQSKTDKAILVMCANKIDLAQKQNYSEQQLQKLRVKHKMKCYKVSALSGQNVSDMFQSVVQQVHSHQQKKKRKFDQSMQLVPPHSSQNFVFDQMKSNRSQKQKQSAPNTTNIKLKKQNILRKQEELGNREGKVHIPGQNRCC